MGAAKKKKGVSKIGQVTEKTRHHLATASSVGQGQQKSQYHMGTSATKKPRKSAKKSLRMIDEVLKPKENSHVNQQGSSALSASEDGGVRRAGAVEGCVAVLAVQRQPAEGRTAAEQTGPELPALFEAMADVTGLSDVTAVAWWLWWSE